jgi:hypothetical protein
VETERLTSGQGLSSALQNLPADYSEYLSVRQQPRRHDDVGALIGFINDLILDVGRFHVCDAP